jgi:hypothetical protein
LRRHRGREELGSAELRQMIPGLMVADARMKAPLSDGILPAVRSPVDFRDRI